MDSPFIPFTEQLLGVGERSSKDSWLSMIVRKELVEINMLLPDFQPSECLLTEIGEYLCHATDIIAQLANRMANGNHIHTYAQRSIKQMEKQTDLSELGLLDGMNAKHSILKNLAEKLEHAHKDISLAWGECMAASHGASRGKKTFGKSTVRPVRFDTSPPVATSSNEIMPSPPGQSSPRVESSTTEAENYNDKSPIMTEPIDSIIESTLKEMSYRGKGSHYCPHRSACMKGGVSADGALVLFERNSAFKAHLEKHLKQYKCNLPGCPNKSGFSRLDLLQRHQAAVPHNMPAELLSAS